MTPTTPTARAVIRHVRVLWRAQWLSLLFMVTAVVVACINQHWAVAFGVVMFGAGVVMVLNTRILRVYRTVLDPCVDVRAETITDIAILVDYYTSAAKGPAGISRPWLPPLTLKRMMQRRAGNPWWAPLGNIAYSSRLSADRSTVIMPFLTSWLLNTTERNDVVDTVAIATVTLRSLWATDIIRQQGKDAIKAEKASEAWLLLGL